MSDVGRPVSDRDMALELLGKIKGVSLSLFLVSVVIGFFVKNQGLFSAEFGSDLLRTSSFSLNQPFRFFGANLITSFFVHFSLMHLIGNYLFLMPAGIYLEKKLSKTSFVVFLVVTHMLTLLVQFAIFAVYRNVGAVNGQEVAMIDGGRFLLGASAVAMGAVSLSLIIAKRYVLYVLMVISYLVYALFFETNMMVSHMSHYLGWIFGTVYYFIIKPNATK